MHLQTSCIVINIALFLIIFIVGEWIVNKTVFNDLKRSFHIESSNSLQVEWMLRLPLSVFKGCLERLVLSLFLILDIHSILVVYGALKIATRIQPDPMEQKIRMDYFLIGNLFSLLIAVVYAKGSSWFLSLSGVF